VFIAPLRSLGSALRHRDIRPARNARLKPRIIVEDAGIRHALDIASRAGIERFEDQVPLDFSRVSDIHFLRWSVVSSEPEALVVCHSYPAVGK
jgi:hypothetical protein